MIIPIGRNQLRLIVDNEAPPTSLMDSIMSLKVKVVEG